MSDPVLSSVTPFLAPPRGEVLWDVSLFLLGCLVGGTASFVALLFFVSKPTDDDFDDLRRRKFDEDIRKSRKADSPKAG